MQSMNAVMKICLHVGVPALACLLLLPAGRAGTQASATDDLGDRQVREILVQRASDRCPGYKGAYAGTLQTLDISLERNLLSHHVVACPDARLDPSLAVVWYGNHRAITWNPNNSKSGAALDKVVRRMVKQDDFSNDLQAFDGNGTVVKGQLLPAFETRCATQKECRDEQ